MADLGALQGIGIAAGAAAASFVATWLAMFKPLKSRIDEPAGDVALLKQRLEALEKKTEKMEEKVGNTVADDEFATYCNHTTEAVKGLSEKVGRLTGVLETWQQMRR